MFISYRSRRAFFYLKPIPFSLSFCTTNTCHSSSFPVSYLIHNLGFSPQSASKLSSSYNLRFKTPENPDSVLSFFRNYGFSDTQLHDMIRKTPWLLSCDPCKRVLPKFEFLASKGVSTSDIINLVAKIPYVLSPSLKNQLVPAYEFIYKFLQSDKDTIALLHYHPNLLGDRLVLHNINLLIQNGVTHSAIATLLRNRISVLNTNKPHMLKVVQELKDLGFHPSTTTFSKALLAKTAVTKTLWKKKVDAFKNWGWSDQDILEAFKKRPHCMLMSVDKINLVISFWVNHLGWDALAIAKGPAVIGCSLERNIIPRAAVVQFLLKKGLRKNNASLTSPFIASEKVFVDKFIKQFVEDSSYLLNLYEEKLKPVSISDKTSMYS